MRCSSGQKLVELEKRVYIAQRDALRAELASAARGGAACAKPRSARPKRRISAPRTSSKQGIQAQELFDQARLAL